MIMIIEGSLAKKKKNERNCTHIRAVLGAYLLNVVFFKILSTIFNARLLYTMAFNSYAAIEGKISKACDAIHDGWYTNCV